MVTYCAESLNVIYEFKEMWDLHLGQITVVHHTFSILLADHESNSLDTLMYCPRELEMKTLRNFQDDSNVSFASS